MNRISVKEATIVSLGLNKAFCTELTQNTRFFPAWYDQRSVAIAVKRTADKYQPLLPVMKVKTAMLRDEDVEDHNY